jgi:hypothetical protein
MVEILEGIAIGIASAIGGGIFMYFFKKKMDKRDAFDFDLDRFAERGRDHVGIRNTGNKTIDACLIFCDEIECSWWDETTGPRAIASGGGANAILLSRDNDGSVIRVKSQNRTLRKVNFQILRRENKVNLENSKVANAAYFHSFCQD